MAVLHFLPACLTENIYIWVYVLEALFPYTSYICAIGFSLLSIILYLVILESRGKELSCIGFVIIRLVIALIGYINQRS